MSKTKRNKKKGEQIGCLIEGRKIKRDSLKCRYKEKA
jgi:hypothetical protein